MAVIAITYRRILYASVLSPPENIPEIPDIQLLKYLLLTIVTSSLFLIFSYYIFKNLSKKFADEL